jgi:hypothetical protein
MKDLIEYVTAHTERNACTCGRCCVSGDDKPMTGHTVDLFFFDVCAKAAPDAQTLKKLIAEHRGEHVEVNLFDGKEHSYIELGAWIGDQGLAMQMMGLGVILGLWEVLHPGMLGLNRNDPMAQKMAGAGMVTMRAKESS